MYNQQVTYNDGAWAYEPVKYWPNEFGNKAISDEVDRLSFFAYAPWVEFIPTTGKPDPTGVADADLKNYQNKNIIYTKKNDATGDPIINYVVDTDPATSVDLLWGVAADTATTKYYKAISEDGGSKVKPGLPFIDLVKPTTGNDKLSFNLMHALAKIQVTIDYVPDSFSMLPKLPRRVLQSSTLLRLVSICVL